MSRRNPDSDPNSNASDGKPIDSSFVTSNTAILLYRTIALWCLLLAAVPSTLCAQTISPYLVGNNLWYASRNNAAGTPSTAVMTLSGQAGIRLIRIGGHEFDSTMPSNAALLNWVNRIRATGAEPLIQISQYGSAAAAAATVQYINVTNNAHVTYWSVGNEPWLQANNSQEPNPTESQIADTIEGYFKPLSSAMKAVDPTIKIFGVDSEDFQSGLHSRLFGGSNNIAGKVPGQNYYYCDGLSWHRYPQADNIDPAYQGLADVRQRIENCRALIDSVNLSQGRSGAEALIWGIGEINSKNGTAVHTWGNGQMFAGFYALSMKYGANHVASWSLFESDGARTGADFSLFDSQALIPRPSYWHTQLTAKYFTGRYLEGNPSISSSTSELLVYGAEDISKGHVSVMILNRGYATRPYTLHLNSSGTTASPGATAINVDALRPDTYSDTLPPRSTHVIVFTGTTATKIVYTNEDFIAGNPPQSNAGPYVPGSPLSGVLDGFEGYAAIAEQGYWQTLHSGAGLATITNGSLALRASDGAYASATIGSPPSASSNFFNRGFAISLEGFAQTAVNLPTGETQFRLCLNSSLNRSFGADDSLVLRVDPGNVRLGYKINQPGVQGELRAGAGNSENSLLEINYTGQPETIRISLEPTSITAGVTTVLYRLQLDGSFGRIFRTGTFAAAAADWGTTGDSSLVLESRRNSATSGGVGSYAEATVGTIYHQPLLLDQFDYPLFSGQGYWTPLTVGTSTVTTAAGAAQLSATSTSFASAAIAGTPIAESNFFKNAFTLDFKDIVLTSANIALNGSYFRISLCSTAQRSFTTPDSLTLRFTPDSVRFGLKLDQPSVDAETRTGTGTADSSFLNRALPGPVTAVRLTLIPTGPAGTATPVLYVMRLTTASGDTFLTGTFTADLSRWGAAGDSSIVLEARRASGVTSDASSYMKAVIGSVRYTPIPDDFLDHAPSFHTWSLRQFSSEELASGTITGPAATPANDGISNLLKYAFGLDAKALAGPGFLPSIQTNPFTFHHDERAGAADLLYTVEASTDLVNWNVPVIEQTRGSAVGGWIPVGSRANVPTETPRVFYRSRVGAPNAP